MAYSVMVWLVYPGEHPQQEEEEVRATAGRESAPGASTGAIVGLPLPRMVYGVYESQDEAERALAEISSNLQQNAPLRINTQSDRIFVIPAQRVHYIACEEVTRPMDE
jgi:hypothetical protein